MGHLYKFALTHVFHLIDFLKKTGICSFGTIQLFGTLVNLLGIRNQNILSTA